MGAFPEPRLPWGPYARAAKITDAYTYGEEHGMCYRTIRSYTERGIPFHRADRLAIEIGLHPATVWGDAWWQACVEMDAYDVHVAERRRWHCMSGPQRRRLRALTLVDAS